MTAIDETRSTGMPSVMYVSPDGTRKDTVAGSSGESVMHIATVNGVNGIIGECGGNMSCATCHVFVDPIWFGRLADPCSDEIEMLEATAEEPTDHSRLSCQIPMTEELDGLIVHLPASQR
jgi:2Fe-2S ferredoxin